MQYEVKFSSLNIFILSLIPFLFKVVVTDFNDNCPQLNVTKNIFITPQPLLQIPPLMSVHASDLDTGANAEFLFHVSEIHTEQ